MKRKVCTCNWTCHRAIQRKVWTCNRTCHRAIQRKVWTCNRKIAWTKLIQDNRVCMYHTWENKSIIQKLGKWKTHPDSLFCNVSPRKPVCYPKSWYDPTVNTVILPVALCLKHRRNGNSPNDINKSIVGQKLSGISKYAGVRGGGGKSHCPRWG